VLAYLESGGSIMELGYGHIVDQKLLDLGLSDRQLDYFLKPVAPMSGLLGIR
jgi:hypothetical protein